MFLRLKCKSTLSVFFGWVIGNFTCFLKSNNNCLDENNFVYARLSKTLCCLISRKLMIINFSFEKKNFLDLLVTVLLGISMFKPHNALLKVFMCSRDGKYISLFKRKVFFGDNNNVFHTYMLTRPFIGGITVKWGEWQVVVATSLLP